MTRGEITYGTVCEDRDGRWEIIAVDERYGIVYLRPVPIDSRSKQQCSFTHCLYAMETVTTNEGT